MNVRMQHSGFSLIELLVVMAIIAIIAGISIPLFARSSFLQNSDLQNASRELYAMLRAAKIQAVNDHLDTAVVYGLKQEEDSTDASLVYISNGVLIARELSDRDLRRLRVPANLRDKIFIRLAGDEGQFHKFPDTTCILNIWDTKFSPVVGGTTDVYVFDIAEQLNSVTGRADPYFEPFLPTGAVPSGTPIQFDLTPFDNDPTETEIYPFLGHVFTPSGFLAAGGDMSTIRLQVAPLPSADPEDRATTEPYWVEIKPSLGRVSIASAEE